MVSTIQNRIQLDLPVEVVLALQSVLLSHVWELR